MLTRTSFWLGLLFGLLASLFSRPIRKPVTRLTGLDTLLDLVADPVLLCTPSGAVTYANAAARTAFGPDGGGLSRLCYPSGQPMPPGQSPLTRARLTGRTIEAADCLLPMLDGRPCILDVTVRPWQGGAVAVFRDVTATRQHLERAASASNKSETLRTFGTRLGSATEAGEVARATVEAARELLDNGADVKACLYAYDAPARRLTRMASDPEDRPRRPRSQRQARLETSPMDANDPMLWQVYVAKQPYAAAGQSLALPLLAGGTAVGHLSLTFGLGKAAGPEARQALILLALLAALALAGLHEKAQSVALAAQVEAVGEVARAVALRLEMSVLADLVTRHVCRLTAAEVCTLAVREGEQLRLMGVAYRDALTFPSRFAPGDVALRADALSDALSSGKTTQRLGLANPALEAGPWSAFAGQSGRHSILALPLTGGRGGLTVYWAGVAPLPADQVSFLETLTLLTAATTSAGRTKL